MSEQDKAPLEGVRLVEFAGIGPVPFAVTLLSDLGAEVLRIDRAGAFWPNLPTLSRGRACIELDLKSKSGLEDARSLIQMADVVVEGFRPGVMERLGLGPNEFAVSNPRLIYARMTGWGQDGPRAREAGHDINYVALSGMLSLLPGDVSGPVPPLNLLGDYAGGSLYMVLGVLAALYERERSGKGQVIDAAVLDGCASLITPIIAMAGAGLLEPEPSRSMLSGSMPYYSTYRCSDGAFFTVGALEPEFRAILAEKLGIAPSDLGGTDRAKVAEAFARHPSQYWQDVFAGSDACAAPALPIAEVTSDPHNAVRSVWLDTPEGPVPAAAPRLSRTPLNHRPEAQVHELIARWQARTQQKKEVPIR